MSMKENLDFVKDELNSEEKFLESFVKLERFYKKNKILILALAGIVVVSFVGINVKNYLDEQNTIKANMAYEKLIKNLDDKQALEELKKLDEKLYDVALYLKKDEKTKALYLKELLEYEKAVNAKDLSKLNDLAQKDTFLLKEFALFNKAVVLIQNSKYEEAQTTLDLIKKESKAYELAKLLKHHLLTKVKGK